MKLRFLKRLYNYSQFTSKTNLLSPFLDKSMNRNKVYDNLERFFFENLPWQFIRHRNYFNKNNRGFGEDAFHSMWYLLFTEFKPKNCLEIGVYRGQVLTLWGLLSKHLNLQCNIAGISPFSSAGDTVSNYLSNIDYLADTMLNHKYFKLNQPQYCIEFSTSTLAHKFISQTKWDLIYIDGSHDYEIVKQDLDIAMCNIATNGLIVIDDSSLYFDYSPRSHSFAGHPGPSQVAKEYCTNYLSLLGGIGHNNIFRKN